MKKLLALLLALAMLVTVTPVFAEETDAAVGSDGTTEEVTYATLAEKYAAEVGNLTRIKEGWTVNAGAVAPASGNSLTAKMSGNAGKFQIVKIDLPKPANGQKLDKLIIRFSHTAGATNFVVLKVEDIDVPNVTSIADTAFYKAVSASTQNPATYKAFTGTGEMESTAYANLYYVDVTQYAQDSYYAGKDFIYLAIGPWNSTSNHYLTTCSDGDYVRAGLPPHYYYSFKDIEAPVALENTIEAYRGLENTCKISETYLSSYGAVTKVTSGSWVQGTYFSGRGNCAIYKITIPDIPAGKAMNNFVLSFGSSKNPMRVFKMPGTDWAIPGSIADTAWYSAVKTASTSTAYNAGDSDILAETKTSYNNNLVNISSYVKECIAAGQAYFYIAVGAWNSSSNIGSSTMTDSTYVGAGHRPICYYSFADMGALELISSPAKGEITDATTATFTFNNTLKSATATVNGEAANCTVNASQVTVDLGTAGKKTIVVTATDTARNTVTTDAVTVRAGYNSYKITSSDNVTYAVNNTGSKSTTYNPQVNSGASTVLTIPLPELSAGQTLGEFNLRFLMSGGYSPSYFRLFKIPVDASQVANLIQTSGEIPEGKINIYEYQQAAAGEYKADFGSFKSELYNTGVVDVNAGHADLTKYALECIERGQTEMLVGFTSVYSNSLIGVGDSSHTTANRFHYSYWTVEDTDFSAKAPKFVASDDANTFATATGLASLAKAAEYKFITSLANFGAEDASVTLYIAQYADGELIGITPKTVTVTANGTAADFTSANFTVDALAENVKAFIWNDAEQKPMLIGDVVVDAK